MGADLSSEEAITTLVIEYALHRIMSKPKITRGKLQGDTSTQPYCRILLIPSIVKRAKREVRTNILRA